MRIWVQFVIEMLLDTPRLSADTVSATADIAEHHAHGPATSSFVCPQTFRLSRRHCNPSGAAAGMWNRSSLLPILSIPTLNSQCKGWWKGC